MRRKAKRIQKARDYISGLFLHEIKESPTMAEEEKKWLMEQYHFLMNNILINDDKEDTI